MIDLKNQKKHGSFKSKRVKPQVTRDTRAKKFLCVILSLVIAFVGVICIAVARKNSKIKSSAQEATGTTDTPPTKADSTSNPFVSVPNAIPPAPGITLLPPGTPDNPTIVTINESQPHLTLVNACYKISDEYKPDLIYVKGTGILLDKTVALKYEEMYNAALAEGIMLTPVSGYHTYEEQEILYNKKVDFFKSQGYTDNEARSKASSVVLNAGASEHNLGYAVDIGYTEGWFDTTKEFTWLQENAADYGFVLRYPANKQAQTGVTYQPWHWRYVGADAAQQIKAQNLTLEEYLGGAQ